MDLSRNEAWLEGLWEGKKEFELLQNSDANFHYVDWGAPISIKKISFYNFIIDTNLNWRTEHSLTEDHKRLLTLRFDRDSSLQRVLNKLSGS